jgi:hypothetical protein
VSGAFELKLLVKSCIGSMHDITASNKDLNSNVLSWTQRVMNCERVSAEDVLVMCGSMHNYSSSRRKS